MFHSGHDSGGSNVRNGWKADISLLPFGHDSHDERFHSLPRQSAAFILVALFLIPFTALTAMWAYESLFLDDPEVRDAWLTLPMGALYIWIDYVLLAKLIWPPELGISLTGVRWSNYAMLQWPANYGWQDIEGPEQTSGAHGVPLLQFVVKATDES